MKRSVLLIVILAMCVVLFLAVPENAAKAQNGYATFVLQSAKRGVIHVPKEYFSVCPDTVKLPKGEKLWSLNAPVVTETTKEGEKHKSFRGYTLQMKPLICVQEQ